MKHRTPNTLILCFLLSAAPMVGAQDETPLPDPPAKADAADAVGSAELAAELEKSLDRFGESLASDQKQKAAGKPVAPYIGGHSGYTPVNPAASLRSHFQTGQLGMLVQLLNSLSASYPAKRGESGELVEMVRQLRAEEEAEEIANLEATFGELADALVAAEEAEELDPWIKELSDLSPGSSPSSRALAGPRATELTALRNRRSTAVGVTSAWQEYLTAKKHRDLKGARSSIASVIGRISEFPYVPRSRTLEIKARLQGSQPFGLEAGWSMSFEHYVARLKTPEDALVLKAEIEALENADRARFGLGPLYDELGRFANGMILHLEAQFRGRDLLPSRPLDLAVLAPDRRRGVLRHRPQAGRDPRRVRARGGRDPGAVRQPLPRDSGG